MKKMIASCMHELAISLENALFHKITSDLKCVLSF